jgi:hypothetical protein
MSGVGTPWRGSRWSFRSFLLLDRNCKQCSYVVYDGDCSERWIHQKVYIARLELLDAAGCFGTATASRFLCAGAAVSNHGRSHGSQLSLLLEKHQ